MSLNVINLSKTYKNNVTSDLKVLKDISFNLPDNGIYFIVGRSGCGKTTLLKMKKLPIDIIANRK